MTEARVVASRYRIDYVVRRGGMGAVYRGWDTQTDRVVAIKEMRADVIELSREAIQRSFMKEAQVLEKIKHPHIPRILEHFSEHDCYYLVMEFIDGISLDKLVREHKSQTGAAVPQRTVIAYALQICAILRYLHENPYDPIIHRDVKPSNLILRDNRSEVVLVDFGLARGSGGSTRTTTAAAGTLGYAPAEQLQGEAEPRSDLYALGATMYHLLTGKDPIPLRPCSPRADCPHLNESLAAVVERATRKSLSERFASAAEMESALRRALRKLDEGVAEAVGKPLQPSPAAPPSTQQSDNDTLLRRGAGGRDTSRLPSPIQKMARFVPARIRRPWILVSKPAARDLAVFTRQLETMLAVGISLSRSLTILHKQSENSPLHAPIGTVRKAVETGYSVAAAFACERRVFGEMYVALLRCAEKHGALPSALGQLATYAERDDALTRRVRSALAYPVFVLVITVVLTYFTVMFAVPPFMSVFASLDVPMPFPTRLLMYLVGLLQSPTAMCIAIALATCAYFAIRELLRMPSIRAYLGGMMLDVPMIGRLVRKLSLARMARCMSTLVRGGLMLVESVTHASDVCGNSAYRESLQEMNQQLMEGSTLTAIMKDDPAMYPAMFCGLVAAGEMTGNLDTMLERAANIYEQDVDHELEVLMTLLEPALMGVTAVVVGSILVALFMPLATLLTRLL